MNDRAPYCSVFLSEERIFLHFYNEKIFNIFKHPLHDSGLVGIHHICYKFMY